MQRLRPVLFVLLAINVMYVLSGVLHFPIQSIDLFSDWLLKAKVLFLSSAFPLDFFRNWDYMAAHMQYPILLPTLFALIYRAIGGVHEIVVLLWYPVIYTAILVLAYRTLSTRMSKLPALVLTYVYSMFSPLLAQGGRGHAGNADIVITLCWWLAVYVVMKKFSARKTLVLVALIAAIASQIKQEGVFIAALSFFLPLGWKQKAPFFVLALLPTMVWMSFVRTLGFASDIRYAFAPSTVFVVRIATIVVGTIREMANVKNWYIFWPLFFLAMHTKAKTSVMTRSVIQPTLLLVCFAYASAYVFAFFTKTPIDISRYVSSSIGRVLLQISPLYFLWFAEKILGLLGFSHSKNIHQT